MITIPWWWQLVAVGLVLAAVGVGLVCGYFHGYEHGAQDTARDMDHGWREAPPSPPAMPDEAFTQTQTFSNRGLAGPPPIGDAERALLQQAAEPEPQADDPSLTSLTRQQAAELAAWVQREAEANEAFIGLLEARRDGR
jgi:hypothetical protein